jgi:hypothetical protein
MASLFSFLIGLNLLVVVVMLVLTPMLFTRGVWACMGKGLSPMPPGPELRAVPGLYGPGAFTAWVLCTISAIIDASAGDHPSSRLSPDLIASLVYSTCSVYWHHGRSITRFVGGYDIFQDYSTQAGSFVFNVSVLLHALGLVFSTKQKKKFWSILTSWNIYLSFISPMTFAVTTIKAVVTLSFILPMVSIIAYSIARESNLSPWRRVPFPLLPFIMLEAFRCQFSTTRILIIPKTTSSLTDLDQFVSLATGITVVAYQWKLWDLARIARRLRTKIRRAPVRSASLELEATIPASRSILVRSRAM